MKKYNFITTVSFRLLIVALSTIFIVNVALHYWFYASTKDNIHSYNTETIELTTKRLSKNLPLLLWNFSYDSVISAINSEVESKSIHDILILDDSDSSLSTSTSNLNPDDSFSRFPIKVEGVQIAEVFIYSDNSQLILMRNKLIKSSIISFLITLGIISISIITATKIYISTPLGVLEQKMLEIAGSDDKNVGYELPLGQQDNEIRRVSAAFNKTISKISRLVVNLNNTNEELEKTNDEREKMQSMLVESEKMSSLGSLVAGVAHEINTPTGIGITAVSTITADIEIISKGLADKSISISLLNEHHNRISENANLALKNLSRVSKLVSSFKQVSADQTIDESREILLHREVDDLFTSIGPKFKSMNATWINNVPDNIRILINPGHLFQILSNIILNAFIHGLQDTKDPTIEVSCNFLEDNQLAIRIEDNGCGMSEDIRARIFDPFFTTGRHKGGTGLGLHIAYNLVRQNIKGQIACQSEVGIGTRFDIIIPT